MCVCVVGNYIMEKRAELGGEKLSLSAASLPIEKKEAKKFLNLRFFPAFDKQLLKNMSNIFSAGVETFSILSRCNIQLRSC